jgi:hypothetical protein
MIMPNRTENLRQLFGELLNRLDAPAQQSKNGRSANGRAEGERRLSQQHN